MSELILCQHQWVEQCHARYRHEPETNAKFETAHFPKSKEMGGTTTVRLLPQDHCVQGLLQTLEFGVPCIYPGAFKRDSELIATHYPEYLQLYWEVYAFCQSYAGTKTLQDGVGIHDDAHREAVAEGRRRGGATQGAISKEKGTGIFDPKFQNPLVKVKNTRKGGIATMQQRKGIFALSAEQRQEAGRKGAASLNSQKYKSLHDGFVSTAGGIASHHRALGVPAEFKVRVAS